jgi:hypothetical protein
MEIVEMIWLVFSTQRGPVEEMKGVNIIKWKE